MSTEVEVKEFIERALEHYTPLYLELKAKYGLKAISDEYVENNSDKIVSSSMWADLAEQLGMDLIVEFAPGDTQIVWVAIAEKEIEEPDDLYELWHVSTILGAANWTDSEKLDVLDVYGGPNKLEIPENILYFEGQSTEN